jgi:hypothetical protein
MSEETNTPETNDGTWTGLKKTIIGTLSTLVAAGGTWLGVQIFGGHSGDKEESKTEQVAPAPAPITINVQQNQENKQKVENGGTNTIIRERVVEKPTQSEPAKPVEKKEETW